MILSHNILQTQKYAHKKLLFEAILTLPKLNTAIKKYPAGRWSDWSRLAFRPSVFTWKHAAQTRYRAPRSPLPTSSSPQGWVRVRVKSVWDWAVGLVWADVQS